MKNLVLGAIVLALSASAFATTHSMHHDSTQVDVTINSRGTDIQWQDCLATEFSAPLRNLSHPFYDGLSMTGLNTNTQEFTLNSLHYGTSFYVCKKFVIDGGYESLKQAHSVNFSMGIDTVNIAGNYLDNSDLALKTTITCKRADGSVWGVSSPAHIMEPVATTFAGSIALTNAVVPGLTVLPKVCIVNFYFQEMHYGEERLSTDGEKVKLELDLEVGIDGE